jgi:hypothetical protein
MPSGTLTFEHTTREGIELVATCQYDAGDRSVGIWPGFFLVEAIVAGAVILDRDAFSRYLTSRELDRLEEYAGDLADGLADDARAEARAAREDMEYEREDF